MAGKDGREEPVYRTVAVDLNECVGFVPLKFRPVLTEKKRGLDTIVLI